MNKTAYFEVDNIGVGTLIEVLKDASLMRDYETLEKSLDPYFEQDLSDYSHIVRAQLNYFIGYYYIHSGKTKNIKDYQEKGRDYLTSAISLFQCSELADEAIEAQVSLGWSYYQTGQLTDYEAWLLDAMSQCSNNKAEVYFSIQVSLLIFYFNEKKLDEAIELIDDINIKKICSNRRIKIQFYHNSARVYRAKGNFQEAFSFYHKAIEIARTIKNKQFEGLSLNSMAHCYLESKQYFQALETIKQSINIFKSLKDEGAMACALDSKASIYFAKGDFGESLNAINAALTYFRLGESYLEFVWALWSKIEILVKLQKKTEIFETFRELSDAAGQNLELKIQREYYQKFEQLCLIPFGETYQEKINTCEREIVLPIIEGSESITEASRKLGFKTHHNLSNLLKRHNFSTRQVRADKSSILPVKKPNINIPLSFRNELLKYYEVDAFIAEYLGFSFTEIVIAVINKNGFCEDDIVLIQTAQDLILTEVVYEDDRRYFVDFKGNTLTSGQWVGRVCGIIKKGSNEFIQI